jgi:uncharacterized protein YozE (UPF0346 family)
MFYPFVLSLSHQRASGDRRDDVGDFAFTVSRDVNWPVFCDDPQKLRAYVEAQGAGPLTLAAFDMTYKEYLVKAGPRLDRMAG